MLQPLICALCNNALNLKPRFEGVWQNRLARRLRSERETLHDGSKSVFLFTWLISFELSCEDLCTALCISHANMIGV